MAFLLAEYAELLNTMLSKGYSLGPVRSYFEGSTPPFVFLRHDVDRFPRRALAMAAAEHNLGVLSTYYFRCNKKHEFRTVLIKEVASLGHEVGFHYDTMSRRKGNPDKAFELFEHELEALRKLTDVKTVSAHGSPLSRFSNIGYTEGMDLKQLGLLGEANVNFDFSSILYITDTGGIYGSPHNLRDWVNGKNLRRPTPPAELGNMLDPQKEPLILLNSHPERWPANSCARASQSMFDSFSNFLKILLRSVR